MGVYSAYRKCNFNPEPTPQEWPGLKFTSQQDSSTVGYTIRGTINKDIYTSTDGKTWTSWDGSTITLNNGEKIYVWNKTNTLSTDGVNLLQFYMSGLISASGNINSMINFSSLKDNCYYHLFEDCTSLTTAPDLPSTTLAQCCYEGMFLRCTYLTTAPDLPATTLVEGCYLKIFCECTNLNYIKLNYTGNFSRTYFESWVLDVHSSGTFYYNGSDTTRGTSAIPTNFTVQTF